MNWEYKTLNVKPKVIVRSTIDTSKTNNKLRFRCRR